MSSMHIVQQGECLASIAYKYQFTNWRTIYDDPGNEGFRNKRPNPNILYPGDEICIPDKVSRKYIFETGRKYHLKLERTKWVFRLAMLDSDAQPLEGYDYEMRVEGMGPVKDKTRAGGIIEVPVNAEARSAKLLFLGEEYEYRLGTMDPVTRITGIQARLNNLGYVAGEVNGMIGPDLYRAMRQFRKDHHLELTSKIDAEFLTCLQKEHDNDESPVGEFEDELEGRQKERP